MILDNETFNDTFPFKPHFSSAAGFRQHYVDENNRESGETILMLHGEPTWGYLFRNVIPRLAENYRVVVPDFMGFGKSETPQNRQYALKDHIDNLEKFVLDLNLRGITLVMHDFGGPAGLGLAIRHPERIKRIVSTNAPVPLGLPIQSEVVPKNIAESGWFQWIIQAYKNGSLEKVLGELEYNILSTMKLNSFERTEVVDKTWLRAYGSPFQTPEECAGAIGWARGVADGTLRFEAADEPTIAAIRRKPAMMIQGMKDETLKPEYFIPLFQAAFPNGGVYRLENAGHYLYEDEPEAIALLIEQFIKLT